MKVVKYLLFGFSLFLVNSCKQHLDPVDDLVPINFELNNSTVIMTGEIYTDTPEKIRTLFAANPHIDTFILLNVPGSADDEANLEAARIIRQHDITTIVPSNGLVASGGTDFFLAGTTRIIEQGAKIGVHSWAADDGRSEIQGHELPQSHDDHIPYLDYYREMGIPQAFYWFTLQAAEADDLYWMNADEIETYQLTTN